MRTRINSYLRMASGGLLLALACAGCATVTPPVEPGPPVVLTASSAAQQLRIRTSVDASSESDHAWTAAGLVRNAVEGRLTAEGFIMDSGTPDVAVEMSVDASLFDRTGQSAIYEGEVQASVTRTHDRKLLGKTVIQEKGTREYGDAKAVNALSQILATKTAAWVDQASTSDRTELMASDITVRMGLFRRDMAQYIRTFVGRVSPISGIALCEVASQNHAERYVTFRVVYYRKRFPEGLLNHLAGIDELELKLR